MDPPFPTEVGKGRGQLKESSTEIFVTGLTRYYSWWKHFGQLNVFKHKWLVKNYELVDKNLWIIKKPGTRGQASNLDRSVSEWVSRQRVDV